MSNFLSPQISKYKISRRGRKLQISDDSRTLVALPKDVPERTWAEILQKEENDLLVFDIREEILEEALRIGYEHYMERQCSPFTVQCAAEAWLKLIDWYTYRHDPGEEPSAHPPCFIAKRVESWEPDDIPDPSPKDNWCKQDLNVVEDSPDEGLQRWPSSSSLEFPIVEEIPSEYWAGRGSNLHHAALDKLTIAWEYDLDGTNHLRVFAKSPTNAFDVERVFPGKVNLLDQEKLRGDGKSSASYDPRKPLVVLTNVSGVWDYVQEEEISQSEDLAAESELLQRVTDYSTEDLVKKESTYSALKTTTPVEASLQGAGDATVVTKIKKKHEKSKSFSRVSVSGRSRGGFLPPLDSRSRVSVISDCRLRNLRLETQYEISSEKVDTPPGEPIKRK